METEKSDEIGWTKIGGFVHVFNSKEIKPIFAPVQKETLCGIPLHSELEEHIINTEDVECRECLERVEGRNGEASAYVLSDDDYDCMTSVQQCCN